MELSPAWTAIITASLTGAAAILAPLITHLVRQFQLEARQLAMLHGEMANIHRHYFYSSSELPDRMDDPQFAIQLPLALYGEPAVARGEMSKTPLTRDEIILALELLLLVRNCDTRIERIVELSITQPAAAQTQLQSLKNRMLDCVSISARVLKSLKDRGKKLPKDAGVDGVSAALGRPASVAQL